MGRRRKLNDSNVYLICQSMESARDLAKKYGVSYITILNYRKKYGKQSNQSLPADPNLV
jgi:transposase